MKFRLIQLENDVVAWDAVQDSRLPGCTMGHGYIATILHDKDHHLEVYEDEKNGNLLGIYLRFDSPIFEDEVEDVIKAVTSET
jgi:hypothetical protein